jgi:hypothetical protein
MSAPPLPGPASRTCRGVYVHAVVPVLIAAAGDRAVLPGGIRPVGVVTQSLAAALPPSISPGHSVGVFEVGGV